MAATALIRISRRVTSSHSFSQQLIKFNHRYASYATAAALKEISNESTTPAIVSSPDRIHWDYRGQRRIVPLGQWLPKIAVDAYVAPNVVLAGQVRVWDGSSVWNGCVLRGDLNKITIGFCSNVQERCVIHAAWSSPTGQ